MDAGKFSIGDKVRRKPQYQAKNWPFGDQVCTVQNIINGHEGGHMLYFAGDDNGWFEGYFNLVSEECVQTSNMHHPLDQQVGGNHYKSLAIQPIEYIVKNNLGWCEGNIVKYITRWKQKGGAADIDKVIHYANLLKAMDGKA